VSGSRPDTSSCSLPPPCPNPLAVPGLSPQNLPPPLPKLDVSPFSTFSRSFHPPFSQGCVSRAERGAWLLRIVSHETGRTTLSYPPGAAAPPSPSAAGEAPPASKTKLQRAAATVSPWDFAFFSRATCLEKGIAPGFAFPPRCGKTHGVGCVRRPAKKAWCEQPHALNNSGLSQQKQLTNSGCI